ncbi:MAG: hypothetical protein AAFX87_04955 [Bacteroidota bacterium]
MNIDDLTYFRRLKLEVATTFRKSYPQTQAPIENWKGQEIVNFQEDLADQVQGRVSEKWFYTHLKSEQDKIPRLDMLNMLSRYCGYQDWEDFRQAVHGEKGLVDKKSNTKSGLSKRIKIIAISLGIIAISATILSLNKSRSFEFCFVDWDTGETIPGGDIAIAYLIENESPVSLKCDDGGCFSHEADKSLIKFIVSAPYYKGDTVVRAIEKNNYKEKIRLKKDDYALMIHYFSNAKVDDWLKRREQLDEMIADDARVYQVYKDLQRGMEIYNKQEFINKLTIPLKSLKNIKIINVEYRRGKIVRMRFIQMKGGENEN